MVGPGIEEFVLYGITLNTVLAVLLYQRSVDYAFLLARAMNRHLHAIDRSLRGRGTAAGEVLRKSQWLLLSLFPASRKEACLFRKWKALAEQVRGFRKPWKDFSPMDCILSDSISCTSFWCFSAFMGFYSFIRQTCSGIMVMWRSWTFWGLPPFCQIPWSSSV